MSITRRKFLGSMGIGSAGLLSGCCCVAPSIKGAATSINSGLLDWSDEIATRSVSRQQVIDAHAHFFNATDMQAGGYLAGPIARSMPKFKPLIKLLAPVVDDLAKVFVPSTAKEWKKLNTIEIDLNKNAINGIDKKQLIINDIASHNDEIADILYKELAKTDFPRVYDQTIEQLGFKNFDSRPFSKQLILDAISLDQTSRESIYKNITDGNVDTKDHPDGLLAFACYMLSYRYNNIFRYQAGYALSGEKTVTTHACGALVDFDRWVGDCDEAYSSMKDQILLNQRLSQLSGGYVKPLVAFNPWTAIKQETKYLDMIEDALKNKGFVGVKIYPPIGFFPVGNSTSGDYPNRSKKPDLKKLDEKLYALYDICLSTDSVVMAHGNHSMGAEANHEQMAGPRGWGSLLKQDKYKNLKVNVGHFGGFHEEDGSEGECWSKQFITLMGKAKNLYGDTGMWEEFLNSDSSIHDELVALLNTPVNDTEKASSRIMFGTDWFMLSKVKNWHEYADENYKNLVGKVDQKVLDQYFYKNAQQLFNI